MNNKKVIGAIIAIVLGVVAAIAKIEIKEIKQGFCETDSPVPPSPEAPK